MSDDLRASLKRVTYVPRDLDLDSVPGRIAANAFARAYNRLHAKPVAVADLPSADEAGGELDLALQFLDAHATFRGRAKFSSSR